MALVNSKGEAVYKCDVCSRYTRIPTNLYGIDVVQRCVITLKCPGKLHRVLSRKEINSAPTVTPAVAGLQDWFQRKVLYTKEQPVQTSEWIVEHNLGMVPTIRTYTLASQDGEEIPVLITPLQVTTIDNNTSRVTFAQPTSGLVQCLSSSSQNTVNPSLHEPVVATETISRQLSNGGEVTIATLDSSNLIDFSIMYLSPTVGDPVVVGYVGIDSQASVQSPWADTKRVFINGRTYTVRSFNITSTPNAPSIFGANLITNGSPFYFTDISVQKGSMLILMGRPPYSTPDKIYNEFVDVIAIDTAQPQIYYQDGEIFVEEDVISTTYPPIFIVE